MSKFFRMGVAVAAALLVSSVANADLLLGFNFNAPATLPSGGIPGSVNLSATSGSQAAGNSISLIGSNWSVQGNGVLNASTTVRVDYGSFTGSTLNAVSGDVAGQDFAIIGNLGGTAPTNTDRVFQFSFSTLAFQDLAVTFAGRRTSSGGVLTAAIGTSLGSLSTVPLTTAITGNSTYIATGLDLSSVASSLANQPTVYVQITVGIATSATGNVRLDNFQVNANPIPEPTALGLIIPAGLVALRRRRA